MQRQDHHTEADFDVSGGSSSGGKDQCAIQAGNGTTGIRWSPTHTDSSPTSSAC
nr:hypothetical protein [Ktedonobacter sp. SOSP1-52]